MDVEENVMRRTTTSRSSKRSAIYGGVADDTSVKKRSGIYADNRDVRKSKRSAIYVNPEDEEEIADTDERTPLIREIYVRRKIGDRAVDLARQSEDLIAKGEGLEDVTAAFEKVKVKKAPCWKRYLCCCCGSRPD